MLFPPDIDPPPPSVVGTDFGIEPHRAFPDDYFQFFFFSKKGGIIWKNEKGYLSLMDGRQRQVSITGLQ